MKTSYPVDGNGNVTVLLKDGYNCIEVNADYEGRNVTQVYALKGKVVRYVVENETRPGMPLRIGDKAGVWIIGKNIAVHKISRIYNNGVGLIRYMTDMPMQGLLVNDRAHRAELSRLYRRERGGLLYAAGRAADGLRNDHAP